MLRCDPYDANLELMPLRMNQSKNAKIGQRQRALAEKFYTAGLLSKSALKAAQRADDGRTH
jgi:hypothetical protein